MYTNARLWPGCSASEYKHKISLELWAFGDVALAYYRFYSDEPHVNMQQSNISTREAKLILESSLDFTSWAKPCILRQYLYTGTIPVNKDFGTCL